jgi:hypothetical protein
MRNALLGLALLGTVAIGTSAHADSLSSGGPMVQPVYYGGDYCGPRCQERRHAHWEARHHRHWEERHYGYSAYPRY